MLTEQRYEIILKLLAEQGSVTVTEIKELLDTSESTVRRDITALHKAGRLTKVFGGAVAAEHVTAPQELTVAQKAAVHMEEKRLIAAYAAGLVEPGDFVYLDAGTTTGCLADCLEEKSATYVTNGVAHAQKLAARGFKVILVGGELKSSTEAVIGSQALRTLRDYHFTKGFFGTNGIIRKAGFTTPDAVEALVKRTAMEQCADRYVLADQSKFGKVSSVTFADFESAKIVTDGCPPGYENCRNIVVPGEAERKR